MKPTELDPVLLPYYQAQDEHEANRLLAQLITEQVEPLIKAIVRHKLGLWFHLRHAEAADVQGDVLVRLLRRFHRLRQGEEDALIKDLQGYVAVTSYNGCAAYVRQHAPRRWHLQNRLRYLLATQPQFQLRQEADGEWVGGLASWPDNHRGRVRQAQVQQLLEGTLPVALAGIPDPSFRRTQPEEQLRALLEWAAHWITLDELGAIFAQWWDLQDQPPPSRLRPNDAPTPPLAQVEQRLYLQQLWQEITRLPLRQRQAFLLNLRAVGQQPVLALLPALQIVSLREIAAALEISLEEFATLWPRLPLADSEIAARLQITRRQVINLRKIARARLLRRGKPD